MLSVPSFLLRKLYVKGSLQSTSQIVSFRLRNSLGSGYAEAMSPLTLDGKEMPMEDTYFYVDSEPRCFDTVSKDNPFSLLLNFITTHIKTFITNTEVSFYETQHSRYG